MNTIENYINSGLLELYVLGMTSDEETLEINELAKNNIEIKNEIVAIETALNRYSSNTVEEISPAVKEMIMATIDYSERLNNGEAFAVAPLLNKNSKIPDFETWLARPNMQEAETYDALHAKIISATPEAKTLIVWLRYGAPPEVHNGEYEHFLIVEGTCNITIGETKHSLVPGDYLSIPLHISHHVQVTSEKRCKIILQRLAA